MTIARATTKVLGALQASNAHTATVFLSDRLTVRATRLRYRRGGSSRVFEARLTVGRPNHEARRFIGLAKRAGEPLPIRKVRLTGAR